MDLRSTFGTLLNLPYFLREAAVDISILVLLNIYFDFKAFFEYAIDIFKLLQSESVCFFLVFRLLEGLNPKTNGLPVFQSDVMMYWLTLQITPTK